MIRKVLAALVTAIVLWALASRKDISQFDRWTMKHSKVYPSQLERTFRRGVFQDNLRTIQAHNQDPRQTYQLGETIFADRTLEEFRLLFLGANIPANLHRVETFNQQDEVSGIRGMTIDWQAKGKVSPVKFQGMCASCWAFATVGTLESQSRINSREDFFSEQQLVDCSGSYGNKGCSGGWMDDAFSYVRDKGITTQTDYPYVAKNQTCKKNSGHFKITNYTSITGCTNMLNALFQKPLSVAVDATFWSLYKSGIFNNCTEEVNHGVLLVGVTDSYWRIKNSWDVGWGENGYIRLARGNTCDVCHYPSYPLDLKVL